MGVISRIIRCFCCKVEDNDLFTPGDNELVYDLNYGGDPIILEASAPPSLPTEGVGALYQQYQPRRTQHILDGRGRYHAGTSDTLQQNGSCSQSSFLSNEELSDAEGGEEEPVKNLGEIVPDVIKNVVVDERWIKCYSSCHMILLVGDGDFSFSACLAKAFGSASNMIATSLDSREFLSLNYDRAISNIQDLERRGCIVINGMDCTKMAKNALLEGLKFDRIIFNFPFAGFFKNKSREAQLRLHQKLVRQFMENAKKMICNKGEIHITHKSNAFHREWNLEHLALLQGLRFIEAVHFNHFDYPGYRTKTGFGGDTNFNCNPSKTYKFGLKNC